MDGEVIDILGKGVAILGQLHEIYNASACRSP